MPTHREMIKSWKHAVYDAQFKLKVITFIEGKKGNYKAAFKLGIKESIKAEITADSGSSNSSDSNRNSDVSAHAPLSNEAILALFRSDTEE